jgi:cysteine desulfurase
MLEEKTVFLDHAQATPIRREVLDRMLPILSNFSGCPSGTHSVSRKVSLIVEEARRAALSCLDAPTGCLRFTSSGHEANNIAVLGLALGCAKTGHIITTTDEDTSVLQACKTLEGLGFRVTYLPLASNGKLDPALLERVISQDTVLLTVSMVNRFTGCHQPISELAAIVGRHGILFHTDATLGCVLNLDVTKLGIDALTVSGHTIYGPQGVGALWTRDGIPLDYPFTESKDIANLVGFTQALCFLTDERSDWRAHLGGLRHHFQVKLDDLVETVSVLEGHPGILVVRADDVDTTRLVYELDHRNVCAAATPYGVRFSFGRHTTAEDLARATRALFYSLKCLSSREGQFAA